MLAFLSSILACAPDRGHVPSYVDGVAKVLNERCVNCHRPGQVAPFSLLGYENAKKYAKTVAAATSGRQMPPWRAVSGYGEFLDENRLSTEEIALLKKWSDAGAPRGVSKTPIAAPKFSSEWTLGKPDLIVSPARAYSLPAEGADEYRNFVIKTDYNDTKWIRAIDVRPGNNKVVHHVIAYLDRGTAAARMAAKSTDGKEGYLNQGGGAGFLPSGSLGGWAPGVRARFSPEGTAFRLEPGETIVLQVHYHKSGKPEVDLTKLALYFASQTPTHELNLDWALNTRLNITPGEKAYTLRLERVIPANATLYGTMPHMHLLGRSMKSWFEFKDGTKKPLIHIDDWDFNWQLIYWMKTPIHIPAGTRHIIEATYDNSESNPRNPSHPPKRVTWGEQTTDEMFLLLSVYALDRTIQDEPNRSFMLGVPTFRRQPRAGS